MGSDDERERLAEVELRRTRRALGLRNALGDEQRRHDRDELVRQVDRRLSEERSQ